MKSYNLVSALILALILTLSLAPAFSQGEGEPQAVNPPEAPAAAAPTELSIYGEVQNVNSASNSLSVQYYDYDSDEEKTIELTLAKDVKIENSAALNDIKKGDWVDATYTVSEGKNIAKSVSVEKEEEVPPEKPAEGAPAPAAETEE